MSGRLIGEVGSSIPPGLTTAPVASREMAYDLAVIGGGNMGAALLGGLLQAVVSAEHVVVVEVYPPSAWRADGDVPRRGRRRAMPSCASAVLSVKPPTSSPSPPQAAAAGATRMLSIAAGVTIAAIESAVGDGVAVLRAMPNTRARRRGRSALARGPRAADDDLDWAERILAGVGLVVRLDEHHIDAVTGLTGSGRRTCSSSPKP